MKIWEYFLSQNTSGQVQQKTGVMATIQALQNNPFTWLTQDMASNLDNMFIFEYSGDKELSPLFKRMIYLSEHSASTKTPIEYLADYVLQKYTDKWNKLYSAIITSDYNPLENYNMEQVETPDITKERNVKTNTKLKTTSEGDSNGSTHGFNSAVPVDTDGSHAESEVTVEGSEDDNNTNDVETETGTRELERHGNIGVTTSQQMLESEVALREKINFYDIVLKDISSMLCLGIY